MSDRSSPPTGLVALPSGVRSVLASWRVIGGVLGFRLGCYAIMTALALWNEYRPAATVPDVLVSAIPYVAWVDRLNYLAWLLLYVPLAAAFLLGDVERWARYMVTGGLVSLARGVSIAVTGLGPPDPAHTGDGLAGRPYFEAFLDLLSPVGVFANGTARTYLTKDLFFSGHTATTLLLALYLWRYERLRWFAWIAHVVVVATVLLSHLHYTIDVLGAYAVTFAIFAAREWAPRAAEGRRA